MNEQTHCEHQQFQTGAGQKEGGQSNAGQEGGSRMGAVRLEEGREAGAQRTAGGQMDPN